MKILMVSSEAVPFMRTGAVANVVVELTSELRSKGHDVRLALPFYRQSAKAEGARQIIDKLDVPLGSFRRQASIWRLDYASDSPDTIPVYFVKDDFYFGRENPYGYLDDYERFIFFTRAALEMLHTAEWAAAESSWRPEVIHGHDWFAGLIPLWLRTSQLDAWSDPPMAFVYTLHNAGFPGHSGCRALQVAGLDEYGIYRNLGETNDSISFMARGVWTADAVNTVSPTHADELARGTYPSSLAQADDLRGTPIQGILNGIDCAHYDPAFDPHISRNFNAFSLHQRRENKLDLQKRSELQPDPDVPLLGMVCRLIPEKGVGLLEKALPLLLKEDAAQVVVLGALGDFHYQESLAKLANQFQGRMQVFFGFDAPQAHRIFAASDIILVPSQYEPCGLQQMIAMRYGAIPVVRKTGGLADTVSDWNLQDAKGRGFVFDGFDATSMLQSVRAALHKFNSDRTAWGQLQRHNMNLDFSWREPADKYLHLYADAIAAAHSRPAIKQGEKAELDLKQMLVHAMLETTELKPTADVQDYFRQTARIIRDLLECDCVLVWVEDEAAPYLLRLEGTSFSEGHEAKPDSLPDTVKAELATARSWSPQYVYRRNPSADGLKSQLGSQLGFLHSEVATELGWQVQLSSPMHTRGKVLGRIDAFYCNSQRSSIDEDTTSLVALASVLANKLEYLYDQDLAAQLQAADRKMLAGTTVRQVASRALEDAKRLLHADGAALRLPGELSYTLTGREFCAPGTTKEGTDADAPHARQPRARPSELKTELRTKEMQEAGELSVWRERFGGFSQRDEMTLANLTRQVAAALQATREGENTERKRAEKLRRLSVSLTGLADLDELLQSVVKTTADVLVAEAASLYLANETGERLEIKAAAGYHESLLEGKGLTYGAGEGMTAWIWEHGEGFRADSLEALHAHPGWKGKYTHLQSNREPQCFLGIPLKAIDRKTGQEKVIGVLKLEDRLSQPGVSPVFNDEDQRLGEMMANVIATVVYNTQLGQKRLGELSTKLTALSMALAGSQERQTLMNNIVEKIAEVVDVHAASLYLADGKREKLTIEAASGYQKTLTEATPKPFYRWGEGVTGRVAKDNRPFQADSLAVLRDKGGSSQGRWDHLQGNKRPESFYGLPLNVKDEKKPIGVLKVESLKLRPFTSVDVLLIQMMGNVIAAVVYNVQISENKLAKLSNNVRELSIALAGGQDRQTLMNNIVEKIAEVVEVDAASLFLADEKREKLIIEAASGYQKKLMDAPVKPFYHWGEGVTGRIAKDNKPFQADSLKELREKGGSTHGQWDHLQEGQVPQSFYGLPLNVRGEEEKPIGVLKVESLSPRPFTPEDVLLIEMMGKVIAAVVYNVQISETKLATFSTNLKLLSDVLTPGEQTAQEWFQKIVDTISKVFDTDAASLYLLDQSTKRVVVAAASGYQRPLMKARAFYELGEGVTGRIADTGESIRADTLRDLRSKGAGLQGAAPRGKYDNLQGGNQPNSFYGVPLKVTGKDQPIGVLKFESLRNRSFSDETCLLIDMMASVIATVIHNTQQGERRVGDMLREMGTLTSPLDASQKILQAYAKETDPGLVDQLACALAVRLGENPDDIDVEAENIFVARGRLNTELRPAVCERISNWARSLNHDRVHWQYGLYEAVLRVNHEFTEWSQVKAVAAPWIRLKDKTADPDEFRLTADRVTRELAACTKVEHFDGELDASETWYRCTVGTKEILGEQVKAILVLLQRQGALDESNVLRLEQLSTQDAGHPYAVVLVLLWNTGVTSEQVCRVREKLRIRKVDVVFAHIEDFLRITRAAVPGDAMRSLVLRQVTIFSPFITMGAVPEMLFFGRDEQIKKLTNSPAEHDYAIIGNRRIGKSSLLSRVLSILKLNAQIRPMKINCQAVETQSDFFRRFKATTHLDLPSASPAGFEECMVNLRSEGRTPILLIDEVDELLDHESKHGEALVKVWRSLAQEGVARFVFFGSGSLARETNNRGSHMHNFGQPLRLGYLSEDAARRVLTEPLDKLEVELEDRQLIADQVVKLTSCHPCLVQEVGELLVDAANQRGERRILCNDIERICESGAFRENYLTTIWGTVGPLGKLITLLAPGNEFSLPELDSELAARGVMIQDDTSQRHEKADLNHHVTVPVHGPDGLRSALIRLYVFSIVEETGQVYRFVLGSLYSLIDNLPKHTITRLVHDNISELKECLRLAEAQSQSRDKK